MDYSGHQHQSQGMELAMDGCGLHGSGHQRPTSNFGGDVSRLTECLGQL